jgi:hypothetical protein
MTGKNIALLALAAVLAVVYAVYFTDWFAPKTFKIFHTSRNLRPLRPGMARAGVLPSLQFGVNRELRFTELKVVPLEAWETNRQVLPLWHLVTKSNSVPVKSFFYGQNISGLRPAIMGTHPELPATNVTYRMFITAGKFRAYHDFELK